MDTENTLISNLDQADGTPLRISATEAVRIELKPWSSEVGFLMSGFVLDVKTPSDTLEVKVSFENKATSGESLTRSVQATGVRCNRRTSVLQVCEP